MNYFLFPSLCKRNSFLYNICLILSWCLVDNHYKGKYCYLISKQYFESASQLPSRHRCFPVNIAKFLRTPYLKNICERLLLLFINYFLMPLTVPDNVIEENVVFTWMNVFNKFRKKKSAWYLNWYGIFWYGM